MATIRHDADTGKFVLYYGAKRVVECDTEADATRLQEAKKPFVALEDNGWCVFDADGLLLDVFDTREEADRYAATGPKKSAGLVTDRMRREAAAKSATETLGITVGEWVTSEAPTLETLEKLRVPDQPADALNPGAMVALMVPADVAEMLAIPGGEPASELHLTLAYFGDAADLTADRRQAIAEAAQATAARFYAVQGQVSGIGRFSGDDAAEGDPIYASYDAPVLPALRQFLVDELEARGVEVSKDHGFTPHITLQYLPGAPPAENILDRLPVTELNFSTITVVIAGERTDFEFIGHLQEACATSTFHVEEAEFFERPHTPAGSIWDVVLIRSGWSKNGNYYTPEALREACARGIFNCDIYGYGSPENAQGMGHLSDAARFSGKDMVRDKAGWTTDSVCRTAEDGRTEVAAVFYWVDPELRARMVEAWGHGNRKFLGFSIDGDADRAVGTAEGRRGYIVTRLISLYETTLVSNPAAGGRFERLVAAVNPDTNKKQEDPKMTRLRTFLRARLTESKRAAVVDTLDDKGVVEAAFSHVKEMAGDDGGYSMLLGVIKEQLDAGNVEVASTLLGKLLDAMGAAAAAPAGQPAMEEDAAAKASAVYEAAKVKASAGVQPDLASLNAGHAASLKAIQEAEKRVQEGLEKIQRHECATFLNRHLAESKLPVPTQDFIRKQFEGQGVFEEARVLEAIDSQRVYLASVMDGGQVQVGHTQITQDSRDKQSLIADIIMGYEPTAEEKPRYAGIYGKRNSLRSLGEAMAGSRVSEATTADFANVLGTSMEKALVQRYSDSSEQWRQIASINTTVENYKTQERVRWNEFAGLPTISESTSTDYSDLSFPSDDKTTYSMSKRGGLVTVTREMVLNDDLQALRDLTGAMARAAAFELQRFVFSLVIGSSAGSGINGDTLYDSTVIYHANHRNTTTTALSYAALLAARQQIQNQFAYGVKTTVASSGSSFANTTDPVQITVASTTGFFAGQYIICAAEICQINSIDSTTTMTVARAKMGTAAASHADSTAIYALARPLDISRMFAVVPYELEGTLDACLRSPQIAGVANNDVSLLQNEFSKGRLIPLPVNRIYLGGDGNNWFLVADPRDIPTAEVAFLGNRQVPEVIPQTGETDGNVFTRDNYRYKIRHEYGGKALDFRGLQGNIVS